MFAFGVIADIFGGKADITVNRQSRLLLTRSRL
jgi:hypothetical protein